MVEQDLKRLQKTGAILSYEVTEKDDLGNLVEVSIRFFPEFDRRSFAEKLRDAFFRAKAAASGGPYVE